jgi:hypothetical protein
MAGGMRLIRVFPRRTRATPNDDLARVGLPTMFDEADEVHISVAFTWDIPLAERLAREWEAVAPVKIGGPAIGTVGGEFEPGKYLKRGYVITSRGCPNKCWFCQVWRREGEVRELQIKDGWNIVDDNLLACSRDHIQSVFDMLKHQETYPRFSGGLEAARLEPWHADLLRESKAKWIFFAYDTPDDLEPLNHAGKILSKAGVSSSKLYCYVLCGYPKDTFGAAEKRMRETWEAGFMPFAMLYRGEKGKGNLFWRNFQRQFSRPAATRSILQGRSECIY